MPTPAPDVPLEYWPLPRQRAFHESKADEVLFGGAAGPGKTVALLMEMFHQAMEQKGSQVILFRRTFPQLEHTLIQGSLDGFPGPGRPGRFPFKAGDCYNASKHTWTLPNGSRVRFGHAQHGLQSIMEYQGQQFEGVAVDELCEWDEPSYRFLLRLLRTTTPEAWPRVRCATNPVGLGFDWVKDRFVQPYLEGLLPQDAPFTPDATPEDPEPMSRAFIPATHTDNPILITADPGYIGRLKQLPASQRLALLEGSWDLPTFDGQLFQPDVVMALPEGATGLEPARFGCNKCDREFYEPRWVRVFGPGDEKVVLEGAKEWTEEIAYECRPTCPYCQGPMESHRYLSSWDLAMERDWTVGVTFDLSTDPVQVVAFERFNKTGWPVVAQRIERRWTLYPGTTLIDATNERSFASTLKVPVVPVVIGERNKHEMILALIVCLEKGRIKMPLRGHGMEQIRRELLSYMWKDKGLVQDCVMALAMAASQIPRYEDIGITF